MECVSLLIQQAGLEFVILVNAEGPVVVQPQVGVKGELAAILVVWIALQILMSDSELDIRVYHPVASGIDFPKPFVQERNLRIDGKIEPGYRLEPDPVEHVGEELALRGRADWNGKHS